MDMQEMKQNYRQQVVAGALPSLPSPVLLAGYLVAGWWLSVGVGGAVLACLPQSVPFTYPQLIWDLFLPTCLSASAD